MISRIEAHIPDGVREVAAKLHRSGHSAWLVGGCIRDLLMGKPVSDWDLATSALPQDVQRIFRRTIPTGLQHGTVTVMRDHEAYEVTTLRGEGAYSDGRRPDEVEFVEDIAADLARRDFTVNAIAYDPARGELIDPFGGLDDLAAKLIRAVRDPMERFSEDGLRVLRAARFCATLEFQLEQATHDAIPRCLDTFRKVSPERVHEEWSKALTKAERPSLAFRVMRETGLLDVTCPELSALEKERFDATMERVDAAPPVREIRWGALLLSTKEDDAERAAWVMGWLPSLRPSRKELRQAAHLARYGKIRDPEALVGATLRRWLVEVGREELDAVLAIARADGQDVDGLEDRARAELASGLPLRVAELAVRGDDVMRVLDVRGRVVGDILSRLHARVLDDPSQADRERLLGSLEAVFREIES